MDSDRISHGITTSNKNGSSSPTTSRRPAFDRNSGNPYKTPVRSKLNQIVNGNLTKPNGYKSHVIETMPNYSPPPKNVSFVKNPFEHARLLKERLSQPFCSPSLFENIVSPSQTESFSWSIDDISRFRPAQIDENPSQDFDSWFSPATESQAQEAINRYFESQSTMESPIPQEPKPKCPQTTSVFTQTTLSLPPNLPPELSALLSAHCFTGCLSGAVDEDLNTSNSSRKKLKFEELCEVSDESSDYGTPVRPKNESMQQEASTPITSRLSPPALSPIPSPMSLDASRLGRSTPWLGREGLLGQQGSSTPRRGDPDMSIAD